MPEEPLPPIPTDQDRRNAAARAVLADRQTKEYRRVLAWAIGAFGPGWLPSGWHYLIDHDDEDRARRTGERAVPAATVYSVRNCVGRKRHFTVEDEKVVEHDGYEAAFGAMLLESHPTRTIEVRGQQVHPHRYSLCWAPIEMYEPRSAEELAVLRLSRERGREEHADRKFHEENPLLALAGIKRKDVEQDGRGR
jgi:hypothetical protein